MKNHPLCVVREFAVLIARDDETVRRWCRAGRIITHGRPGRIHYKQACQFGLSIEEAHALLIEIRRGGHA